MRRLAALAASAALAMLGGCAGGADIREAPAVSEPASAMEPVSTMEPASGSPAEMRCLYYERELFLSAMSAPRAYEREGRLAAGMIPHHLLASDMIAGFFRMAAEDPEGYDTVLFVSPSHFPENCESDVVTAVGNWKTPYGTVEYDAELTEALLRGAETGAENNPAAMEADHGVAGLVPFVAYYLPETKVAACLLSNKLDRQRLAAVWEQVAELCAGGRVLLVASVDCSHYLTPDEAARRDAETAEAIEALDFPRLLSFSDANVDSPQALTTFLKGAQAVGGRLRRLDHSGSGEKLPHALSNPIYRDGVTTYFVYAAFTGPEAGS